jgi:IS30 family transposase
MRLFRLHKNIYKLSSYALSQEKCEVHRKKIERPVREWEFLKAKGLSDSDCQRIVGISRATYYRFKKRLKDLAQGLLPPTRRPRSVQKRLWGEAEIQAVLKIRSANPTYGKAKIAVILKRDHSFTFSESTVGRILKYLKEKGLVQRSDSAPRPKRNRKFKGYAQPWEDSLRLPHIGSMIQIDHMTVYKNGITIKHFQAWDPNSKYIYANVFSQANSRSAQKFLEEFIQIAPFKIQSIQVDGGSEFMKHFEQTCQKYQIPLYILPPRRPQLNGGVERGNRIFREEFYNKNTFTADSIGATRAELKKALQKYNTYRPHNRLKGMTPLYYIQQQQFEKAA